MKRLPIETDLPARPQGSCGVIAQVTLSGCQDIVVYKFGKEDGMTVATSYVTVRIGGVLFRLEDRNAVRSLVEAASQAAAAGAKVFGTGQHRLH